MQCSRNTDLTRTALARAAEDGGLLLLTRGISMFGVERVFYQPVQEKSGGRDYGGGHHHHKFIKPLYSSMDFLHITLHIRYLLHKNKKMSILCGVYL